MIYVNIKEKKEDLCDFEMKIEGSGRIIANQLALMLKQIEKKSPLILMHAIEILM